MLSDKIIDLSDNRILMEMCVLELFYATGIRISELVRIKIQDIDFNEKVMKVLGKGNKERIVPIGKIAKNDALKYISYVRPKYARKSNSMGILFLSNRGSKISRKRS